MSIFKRVTLAVSAQLDRLVGELENHDAVVEAGIRDSRRLYAQAKVRHGRLCHEGEGLRRRLAALRSDEQRWRERALDCDSKPSDEDMALECLSRARKAAEQAAALEVAYQNHLGVERRLAAQIAALRERVDTLQHRRSLMRTRQAAAAAAGRIQAADMEPTHALEETFERWEVQLTEAELGSAEPAETDTFEAAFLASEERASLRAELDALRRAGRVQEQGRPCGGAQ